jgi:hypothetical protein
LLKHSPLGVLRQVTETEDARVVVWVGVGRQRGAILFVFGLTSVRDIVKNDRQFGLVRQIVYIYI